MTMPSVRWRLLGGEGVSSFTSRFGTTKTVGVRGIEEEDRGAEDENHGAKDEDREDNDIEVVLLGAQCGCEGGGACSGSPPL
jgi:hypothetical protein